jgi:AcrR family transcriptional regulator
VGRTAGEPASTGAQHRDTKRRLLDAAEWLFAAHGFEGTSMRAVTQAADTSLSAANYHFGSKQALLRAALVRRIEPLNRMRLEALDALEREVNDAVPVEPLLDAFLRPGIEMQRVSPEEGRRLRLVAAQLYADPHPMVSALKLELFGPVVWRYTDALERALPNRAREDLVLDFQFFIAVMVHVMSGKTHFGRDDADASPHADDEVLDRLVTFAAAGLRSGSASVGPRAAAAQPRSTAATRARASDTRAGATRAAAPAAGSGSTEPGGAA